MKLINYKGQTITVDGNLITVFFEGDEVVMESIEAAKRFIDTHF